MRADRIARLLLGLGLVVGAAAGLGLLVGFEPAQLPRALLNIAAYKLTFLAAGGLIAAGALLRRYARADRFTPPSVDGPTVHSLDEGTGPTPPVDLRTRDAKARPGPL